MTDYKQLCAELADELDAETGYTRRLDGQRITHPTVARARAALAEPEPEGPTDQELLELSQHHSVSYTMSDGAVIYPLQEGSDMRDDVLSFARAVLARWGRPAPQPPADGEVAELVAKLRRLAPQNPLGIADPIITRAADLLEHLSGQPY